MGRRRTSHDPEAGPAFLTAEKEEHEDTKNMKETRNGGRRFSALSHLVIGCAIDVHRELGPGLLESTYRRCFTHELALKRLPFEVEAPITIEYKGLVVKCAYRIDVFVHRQIVVEVKSVDALRWIHEAQVLTYMKHSGTRSGFLINFNARRLKDGLRSYTL